MSSIINPTNTFKDLFNDKLITDLNTKLSEFLNNYVDNRNMINPVMYKNKVYDVMKSTYVLNTSNNLTSFINQALGRLSQHTTKSLNFTIDKYNYFTFKDEIINTHQLPNNNIRTAILSLFPKPTIFEQTNGQATHIRLHIDLSIGVSYSSRFIFGSAHKSSVDSAISESTDEDDIHLELVLNLHKSV